MSGRKARNNKVPAKGACPLEEGDSGVNIMSGKAARIPVLRADALKDKWAHGQIARHSGGASVRVLHEPSGAWYFSPGTVRAMAWHPAVVA